MTPLISTADAAVYFAGKLHTRAWDNAPEPRRFKALCEMTRRINRLQYAGQKADPAQPNAFPRKNENGMQNNPALSPFCDPNLIRNPPIITDSTTPQPILDACCEGAYELLNGVEPEKEYEKLSTISDGLQNARATYDRAVIPEHIVAGIPSVAAWQLLKPYLRAGTEIRFSRVS